MAFNSINTNVGAMIALQSLNAINRDLSDTLRHIATGLAISSPKDNPAVWAIAHRLCRLVWKILHAGVRYIEQGGEADPRTKKKRAQMLTRALRKLGYQVTITPINQITATNEI